MFRLNVKMKNGNTTYFYFTTRADAVEYRAARNMAANSAIARAWIDAITFETWRAAHV